MDIILNTLKAGLPRHRMSLQYYEEMNNYDNELEYTDFEKIPTLLSCNPSQYEKDLRNIVLDLYSDRKPDVLEKEPGDVITMNQHDGLHITSTEQTPSCEIAKLQTGFDDISTSFDGSHLSDDFVEPRILYRYKETVLINDVPKCENHAPSLTTIKTDHNSCDPEMVNKSAVSSLHYSKSTGETFGNSEGVPQIPYDPSEAQLLSTSFSDSGIQIEYPENDSIASECDELGRDEKVVRQDKVDGVKAKTYDEYLTSTKHATTKRGGPEVREQHHTVSGIPSDPALFVDTSSPVRTDSVRNNEHTNTYNRGTSIDTPSKTVPEDSNLQLVLVNMEGKLETLTSEYTKVLEEKKELQDKLKINENQTTDRGNWNQYQNKDVQLELDNLRGKKVNLERTIANLHLLNDDKTLQVSDAEEKLKSSQLCIQNLQQKLQVLEGEVFEKSSGVEALEKELLTLKSALEETRLHYEESVKEKTVLSSDVSTLVNAKSWLIKQLEKSKEVQVNLQLQLNDYDATILTQNRQVEFLKCENARVSKTLAETQEKAISEKAMILEHLEKVESDLVSQDIALRNMQSEKTTIQRELGVKIKSLENENGLLQNLVKSAQILEQELQALRTDAQSKETLLVDLKKEKDEISQQLSYTRNVNDVCEKNIQILNCKLLENEKKLKSLAEEKETQQATIKELEINNEALTRQICEAQEEKDALDNAVQMLRLELDKVERRFKIMKRELALKANQLKEVTKQKDGFINELRVLRDELEQHKSLMEELRDTIRQRDETIHELQSDKAKVHAEACVLSEHLKRTQLEFHETRKEKDTLHEQLQASNSDLSHVEKKYYDSCSEKAKLEGELESTKRALEDYTTTKQVEHESLKHEMNQVKSAFQYEATRHRDEAINLKQEIEFMKGQLAQKRKQHKNEVAALEKKLTEIEETMEQEKVDVRKRFEDLVSAASEKLEREKTERKQEISALNQEKQFLTIKCTELEERAKNAAAMQQNRIHTLESELRVAKIAIEDKKRELEKLLLLSVELEREKGRLAGLRTSQKALREHCSNVEELSASRELKISKLQTKLEDVTLEKETQRKEAQSKLIQLESTLKTQSERIDDLRLCLGSERKQTSQLKIKLNTNEQEAENTLKKLTKAYVDLENASSKCEKSVQELKDKEKIQQELRRDVKSSQAIAQTLENENQILKEREKIQNDLTQAIEWKLNQRSKELEYAKEQLRLSDERHQSEIETLKTAIQVVKSEAAYLRREVSIARKSKCENQEKYFTSRDELISARQETQITKQDLFAASQQLRYLKSAILNSLDMKELQEFVKSDDEASFVTTVTLETTSQDNAEFKSSLNSLRECMSSLRNQISTLQEQMNNHTTAICTAASSWRSFEKNVQNLQMECASVQKKAQVWSAEKDISEDV
ncbi:golgin subfamily A member 3 [Exaiptasia diaphana]|uniref:Uncharacterized protein n=1 Tax=Exaiptasia diaphana TaxID=2652724 RepID=A0A913YD82_EXADI|nr:golgin subfamily A member 3 [Exaiptasia diaphana]KXJ18172.1 Golgin subfamily A member 3 [Exaiptasia diaphana]